MTDKKWSERLKPTMEKMERRSLGLYTPEALELYFAVTCMIPELEAKDAEIDRLKAENERLERLEGRVQSLRNPGSPFLF